MSIIDSAYAQFRAWNAATTLASENESERKRAMQTLRELGTASLPSLQATARRTGAPRAQFAAAVVLHWLGEPAGLPILLDALCWQLPTTPALARDLEAGFIAIGAPDAVEALMRVWRQMAPVKENRRALKTICRVWTRLGDARPLPLLVTNAELIPELFEEFVPTFQDKAIPYLIPLCSDPAPVRRSLAVRALRHIEGENSAKLLFVMLRDTDAGVRALAAQAIDVMQRQGSISSEKVCAEILIALQEGYSTAQGVELLLRRSPPPVEDLIQLVLRWNRHSIPNTNAIIHAPVNYSANDTLDAVLAVLPELSKLPLVTGTARSALHLQLASVLERRPEPALIAGIARVLTLRGRTETTTDKQIHAVLLPLLAHTDNTVRNEVASALSALGDPVGKHLQQILSAAWPQGNWRDKLQILLRGGSEVSQVASEAVLWFTRKSKETAEQWGVNAPDKKIAAPPPTDPLLPDILRKLLDHALNSLSQTLPAEQSEAIVDLCVACIRALVRLNLQTAPLARRELILALNFCKAGKARSPVYSGSDPLHVRKGDIGEDVRLAAGQALIALYAEQSFPLFLQCLYAPELAVRITGVEFLGELADVRSLSHLQRIAVQSEPLLSECANQAITRIRHLNPETMILLRASSAVDSRQHTLLRPASGNSSTEGADILLRSSQVPKE